MKKRTIEGKTIFRWLLTYLLAIFAGIFIFATATVMVFYTGYIISPHIHKRIEADKKTELRKMQQIVGVDQTASEEEIFVKRRQMSEEQNGEVREKLLSTDWPSIYWTIPSSLLASLITMGLIGLIMGFLGHFFFLFVVPVILVGLASPVLFIIGISDLAVVGTLLFQLISVYSFGAIGLGLRRRHCS